jgi:phage shock protein A
MFERLAKLMKGFMSMFVSGLEQANPRALLEAEIVSFQEAVANFNTNLAKQAGMTEKQREQVKRLNREADALKGRTAAMMAAGQTGEAGRLALQLKQTLADAADAAQQLEQSDELYKNLTRQRDVYVRDAQRRIEAIKAKLSKAEMAESQAKLAEIANNVAFDMSGSGASLNRLEQNLDERVAVATGKARVATDMSKSGEWAIKEEESKALESAALAEFASSMGLTAPPMVAPSVATAPLADPIRDLGPAQKTGA